MTRLVIAIDGYSSTGKSTLAKLIAGRMGLLYLDSGALYRAVTLYCQENGLIDGEARIDIPALAAALPSLEVSFRPDGTCLGDRNVEKQIRSMAVSSQVSPVSAVPQVREYVNGRLHSMAASNDVVMDGRDIGTSVFPDARVKIFLTASPEARAQRRYDEIVAKGGKSTLEEVAENLRSRDYMDSHREVSPLRCAPDAFVMDNSSMTLEEELIFVNGLVRGRLGIYELEQSL